MFSIHHLLVCLFYWLVVKYYLSALDHMYVATCIEIVRLHASKIITQTIQDQLSGNYVKGSHLILHHTGGELVYS